MAKLNQKILFLGVICLVIGLIVYAIFVEKEEEKKALSIDEAVQKAIDYINKEMLSEGQEAVLVDKSDEGYVYKFTIKIAEEQFDSFVTKDGSLLFPEGIKMEIDQKTEKKIAELKKSERPDVKLFVMSYCPYGLQAEKALLPSWQLLKDKADIGIYFVDYIMHEKKEIDENLRQYCIGKEEPGKIIDYLSCFVQKGDNLSCLASAKIDQNKLNVCINTADKEFNVTKNYQDKASWLSGSFPKFEVHAELNDRYGVQGSPTLVINGVQVQARRSPEGFKEAICSAFNNPPAECEQELSDEVAGPGFGTTTGSSGSGSRR